jgi:hypothetical protein
VGRLATVVLCVFLGSALSLVGGVARSDAISNEVCTETGPLVCVSLTGTPATVPPSTAASPHFVSFSASVVSKATSTVTHAIATVTLSGGLSVVSATSSAGSCTTTAGTATCPLGNLASGANAAIDVTAMTPAGDASAGATLTVSFDESFNDSPSADPKQDTVSASTPTTVGVVSGSASSFVPQGMSVELSTDPTDTGVATSGDPLVTEAAITHAPASVTALIEEVAAPLTCPKHVLCRGGDWLHASVPGTYDPPLGFTMRWDATLIPNGTTKKKFAVIYTECLDGCPLQIVTAGLSTYPYLTGVTKLPDGDWEATLVNNHNGYMR